MYKLDFISERDFKSHVLTTLQNYDKSLKSINLEKFNSNIVDPIKLLFDKSVYQKTFDEVIQLEIHRQRDKSNNNAIGYFHQNIFDFIRGCSVPSKGWDIICKRENFTIYVEMKNKHNTMNSSSSQKTYIQMQDQILRNPRDYCYLVEVIAPYSRNIPWGCSINGRHCENEHIRRVSIDQFYRIITGNKNSFFDLCNQLPITINDLIKEKRIGIVEKDTVLQELARKSPNKLKALYLLAFENYEGFGNNCFSTEYWET